MKILEKDSQDKWNTIPPVPDEQIRNVNCHKFVLYIMKQISWEDMISDPRSQRDAGLDFIFDDKALNISTEPFIPINNPDSLFEFIQINTTKRENYIVQILDVGTEKLAHSFIIEIQESGIPLCFDKPGFKYSFDVCEFEKIFNFVNKDNEKPYLNQRWRILSLDK